MDIPSGETLERLLEPGDPAVRASALVALCDADPSSPEVVASHRAGMHTGPIAGILSHQGNDGGWHPDGDYHARGTMACLPQLCQLGAVPGRQVAEWPV